MSTDTGYFINKHNHIIGPMGAIGLIIDKHNHLTRSGKSIDVFIKNGYFFRSEKARFFIFKNFVRTGHKVGPDNKILGDKDNLPWKGR